MTTPNTPLSEEELRQNIINLLCLEVNLDGHLVMANFEDFQSEWSFTVDQIMALITRSRQQLLDELEAELDEITYYELVDCPDCKDGQVSEYDGEYYVGCTKCNSTGKLKVFNEDQWRALIARKREELK